MKSLLLIFTFISLNPFLNGQQKEPEFIPWNEKRQLIWDDFLAPAQKIGNTAALTVTHLGFSYHFINGKLSYIIECKFEKDRSWGLVKNDWILGHEQGHFDIAEIYARKLFKELNEYTFNEKTFEKDLTEIYQKVVKDKDSFQQLYDRETEHSKNKEKQEEWLKKISETLKELSDWSDYS